MPPKTTAKRHRVITVAGIEGTWASCSGGGAQSETTESWDGGSDTPEIMTGPGRPKTVTVRRPFKPQRDAAIYNRYVTQVGRFTSTVTDAYTDVDFVPIDQTRYHGVLTDCTQPEADASSGEDSMLEMVFTIERISS